MGPRFCKRGNSVADAGLGRADQLQWGHAFVSVETPYDEGRDRRGNAASMGPRFCKRGNRRCAASDLARLTSFNGATLL